VGIGLLGFIFVVVTPFLCAWFLTHNYSQTLYDKDFSKKYEQLYDGFDIRKKSTIFFIFFFFLRRMIFAITTVYIPDFTAQ